VIRLDAVSKAFRGTPVLDAVSLEVGAGERIALIGANGAGKTTLFRCLLGEYRFAGELTIDGLSPRAKRREVLTRVGFVPQLPPPLRMPVGQLLGFAATLCAASVERMEEVAQRLGLDVVAVRSQPFEKLSGGQKQKVLIAVALRDDVDVLVLDEPAANLDPEARAAFFDLLRERPPGDTMLIAIHRLDELDDLVTRVVELDQGRVALDRPHPAVREAAHAPAG
jgi:ABC-2 type transport system ATP-binding protein